MTVSASAGPLEITVDPDRGARLISLRAHGHELLSMQDVPGVEDAVAHGCFPMVPWAGRVRDGLLREDGSVVAQLPRSADGHALHGLGRDVAWEQVDELTFSTELGDPWPVHGRATLGYRLHPAGLDLTLDWDGGGPGASLGFHPWWRRALADGTAGRLDLPAQQQVERGDDGLPTGRLIDPLPGPWDDCFVLAGDPQVVWPGRLRLTMSSDASWWVVFTEPEHAVCVEPQTAPPDAWNHPQWTAGLDRTSVTLRLAVEPLG